ncbi:hypothetical protein [Streptomyces cellulosae]|uniref:Uncharacterized protein n=1 Tax=Streptomyces cellulosae TaxID=1968 RepID=A0ABW7Y733_STRCE
MGAGSGAEFGVGARRVAGAVRPPPLHTRFGVAYDAVGLPP